MKMSDLVTHFLGVSYAYHKKVSSDFMHLEF